MSSGPCRPNLWCHPPPASMDLKAARCLGWRAAPDEGMGVNWSNPLLAQVCWTRPLEKGALTLASQLRQGEGQRRLGEALKIREIQYNTKSSIYEWNNVQNQLNYAQNGNNAKNNKN